MQVVSKDFETRINLKAYEIYSGILSDEQYVINFLRDRFESRCLDGTFVVKITKIVSRDMVTIDKYDLDGGGSIHVRFRADVRLYTAGDVLVGCKLLESEKNGRAIGRVQHCIVHVRSSRSRALRKGDEIMITILRAGYPLGGSDVVIDAEVYSPSNNFHMKLVRPYSLTNGDKQLLESSLREIAAAEKSYESIKLPDRVKIRKTLGISSTTHEIPAGIKQEDIKTIITDLIADKAPLGADPVAIARHAVAGVDTPMFLVISPDILRKHAASHPWFDKNKYDVRVDRSEFVDGLVHIVKNYVSYLNIASELK